MWRVACSVLKGTVLAVSNHSKLKSVKETTAEIASCPALRKVVLSKRILRDSNDLLKTKKTKKKKSNPPPQKKKKKKPDFAQMTFLFNIIICLHYLPLKVRKRHGIFCFFFLKFQIRQKRCEVKYNTGNYDKSVESLTGISLRKAINRLRHYTR